jgi:FkbM family methyltransferase
MATTVKRFGPLAVGRPQRSGAATPTRPAPGPLRLAGLALGRLFGGLVGLRKRPAPPRTTYCYLGDNRALTLTHQGHQIYLDTRDIGMTPHIALHGTWEDEVEAALARLVKPRQRIIEVGANMGYHTVAMAHAIGPGGDLHAIEANPEALALLRATLTVNGLNDVATVHAVAALDHAGEVEFAVDPNHIGSGHWALPTGGQRNYTTRFSVPAVTLDGLLLDRLGRVDLLRMDAEGSEPQVLRGAAQLIANSPNLRIVTEWAPGMMVVRTDIAALVAWLEGMGFRFWRIGPLGRLDPVPGRHLVALSHCDLVMSRQDPD